MVHSVFSAGRRGPAVARSTADAVKSPATIRRRLDRVTLGLCLGGVLPGMAGCAVGTVMPYRQAVAVALSALWWGIYLGGFGAALGAIIAEFTDRTRAVRLPGPDDARHALPLAAEPLQTNRLPPDFDN